jgi:DNA-binding GntR family transcriptional regulator
LNKQKLPRYISIAETIRQKIKEGALQSGSLLPSQLELARKFSTSVMTVRQALSVLEAEGLIVLKQGVGTFVATGGISGRKVLLQGFQNEMSDHKIHITTKIIEKEYSCSDARAKGLLGIKGKERICCLTRLRLLDTRRIILQRTFMPSGFAGVIEEYSEDQSLYSYLGKATGQVITRGQEIIRAVFLNKIDSRLLEKPEGAPAFLSYRLSTSLSGSAVLFDEAFLAGDSVVISANRVGHQYRFHYNVLTDVEQDFEKQLLNPEFWEEWS